MSDVRPDSVILTRAAASFQEVAAGGSSYGRTGWRCVSFFDGKYWPSKYRVSVSSVDVARTRACTGREVGRRVVMISVITLSVMFAHVEIRTVYGI